MLVVETPEVIGNNIFLHIVVPVDHDLCEHIT
jgi:hypothetical protein